MSIGTYPPQIGAVPIAIQQGGTNAITVANARTNLGLGSMAQQDASAVVITGGSAANLSTLGIGTSPTESQNLDVLGRTRLNGIVTVGPGVHVDAFTLMTLRYPKDSQNAIKYQPTGSDAYTGAAGVFLNVAGTQVGSITTTASATAYNTSSDARLKHAIEKLVGSLDIVRQLNPIHFRWNSTDEKDEGFLAHELQQIIPAAVTGEPDAINDDGSIRPQQVDNSKLVPWLVGAIQELSAQVQTLTARITELEGAANAT